MGVKIHAFDQLLTHIKEKIPRSSKPCCMFQLFLEVDSTINKALMSKFNFKTQL